jgi:hypothetical protein
MLFPNHSINLWRIGRYEYVRYGTAIGLLNMHVVLLAHYIANIGYVYESQQVQSLTNLMI